MALKDIEVKQVIEALGISGIDEEKVTIDDIKSHIGQNFILRANAEKDEELKTKFTGSVLGKLTTKAAQEFDLPSSEVKGKKMEEIFEMVKGRYQATIKELEEKAGHGNDKKLEELTKQLTDYKAKYEAVEAGKNTLAEELEKTKAEAEGKIKSFKLNDIVTRAKSAIPFSDEFTKDQLKRNGFESLIASSYVFDIDENDKPIVRSKADNKIVMSPTAPANFASIEEVLKLEAEKNGVLKKNNAAPVKTVTVGGGGGNTSPNTSKVDAALEAIRAAKAMKGK